MSKKISRFRKPEHAFLLIASLFGVIFLLLTPPFQSPDENRHFYRAYHISLGNPFPTKMDSRVGGYLPRNVHLCTLPFFKMKGNKDVKTTRNTIISELGKSKVEKMVFVDFPASSVYTPISYLPQAIGMRLIRIFSDSAILALYAGRLMTLICWMVALFYAIRITPIFKWLVVALSLLPMSMFIHVSLNADMMTNASVFLLIAFMFKYAFSSNTFSRKKFMMLVTLVVWVASVKFLYIPLILLFFIIPRAKFSSRRQMVGHFTVLCLIALGTTVLWPIIQGVGYVSYADYNPEHREYVNLLSCANVGHQLAYILSHGTYIFQVIWNSTVDAFGSYTVGYIGTFGWGEFSLSTFWIIFAYVGLTLIALNDGNSSVVFRGIDRFMLLTPFVTVFVLIILSQVLIWTCVGADISSNLQGRYLIPIAPLLFFMLYRSKSNFQRFLPMSTIVFSSILLSISAFSAYQRFFIPLEYETETIRCDHENGEGTIDFRTSIKGVSAGNGFSRSNEKARSGSFSSKLTASSNYGTIISFEKCNAKDMIEMEAWRFGEQGMLVVSSEGGKKLFQTESKTTNINENKWNKLHFTVHVPPSIKNEKISCYVAYFQDSDSCYFDDIQITYHRLK